MLKQERIRIIETKIELKVKEKASKGSSGRCNYCGRRGHYFYECKFRKNNLYKNQTKNKFNKRTKNKRKFQNDINYVNTNDASSSNYDKIYADAFTKDYNKKKY